MIILSVCVQNYKKFPKMERALQLVHEIEKKFVHNTDEEELEVEFVDEFMHKIRKAVVEVGRLRVFGERASKRLADSNGHRIERRRSRRDPLRVPTEAGVRGAS